MDPLNLGRVKVRCFDWHTPNKGAVPTSDLPWAQVVMPANNASISGVGTSPNGLKQGSWVLGFFLDGQYGQRPMVIGSIPGIPSYKADETTKGKTPPDEYEEVKEVASPDGTFDDVDEISDKAVKEVLDEIN